MKKISDAKLIKFLREKLTSNPIWAERALFRIYENQSDAEKSVGYTNHQNGIGFTGSDSTFLSSVAKNAAKYGNHLTQKQVQCIMPKMGKYARQLFSMDYFDKEKLIKLYEKERLD
jgi:hypothetical protein